MLICENLIKLHFDCDIDIHILVYWLCLIAYITMIPRMIVTIPFVHNLI